MLSSSVIKKILNDTMIHLQGSGYVLRGVLLLPNQRSGAR